MFMQHIGEQLLGFRYNNHPALIFMGDTGSQFLGFVTGVLAVILTQHTNRALNPALLLLLQRFGNGAEDHARFAQLYQ